MLIFIIALLGIGSSCTEQERAEKPQINAVDSLVVVSDSFIAPLDSNLASFWTYLGLHNLRDLNATDTIITLEINFAMGNKFVGSYWQIYKHDTTVTCVFSKWKNLVRDELNGDKRTCYHWGEHMGKQEYFKKLKSSSIYLSLNNWNNFMQEIKPLFDLKTGCAAILGHGDAKSIYFSDSQGTKKKYRYSCPDKDFEKIEQAIKQKFEK
jgi:hypothetical protein